MWYRNLIRPLLFSTTHGDPEDAHQWVIALLKRVSAAPWLCAQLEQRLAVADPRLARTINGLRFPNPVGLAAGFDKNGVAVPALIAAGFGFLELGTITPRPQPGNPRPRLFRLPVSEALINRLGFNNLGAAALAEQLRRIWPALVPIGVSLGRNKTTPEAQSGDDYCQGLRLLHPHFDYCVINVSSPNTPGLRDLQTAMVLDELLARIQQTVQALSTTGTVPKPLWLKIDPDLNEDQILALLEICAARGISGIIACNTSLSRHDLAATERRRGDEMGGLSGRPLTLRARERVAFIHRATQGRLPIIGVGGIMEVDDALRMLDAGACLIQLYTGLIYAGFGLIGDINRALLTRAAQR